MSFGVAAKFALTGLDSNGTHVSGQAFYWEKNNGGPQTINISSLALGISAAAANLNIRDAVATDCNTQFSTNYNAADVVLADGFVI